MKNVLLIHGFPQELSDEHPLCTFFSSRKYKIFAPKMFSGEKEFSLDNAIRIIKECVGKNRLHLILGFSLGGMILPYIAKEYPDAKIIFVSTGIRFQPRYLFHKASAELMRTPMIYPAFWLARMMPYPLFSSLYGYFNPCRKNDDPKWYEQDKKCNYDVIRSMDPGKARKILDLIVRIDNASVLKKLKNRTLILAGEDDVLMPMKGSKELQEQISGSRLVSVKKGHFGVIERSSLEMIDGFI